MLYFVLFVILLLLGHGSAFNTMTSTSVTLGSAISGTATVATWASGVNLYCIGTNQASVHCYNPTTNAQVRSEDTGNGNIFWMDSYSDSGFNALIWCTDNGNSNSRVYSLDMNNANSDPIQRISFGDDPFGCSMDVPARRFLILQDRGGNDNEYQQLDMNPLNPAMSGTWQANPLVFNDVGNARPIQDGSTAVVRNGASPDNYYLLTGGPMVEQVRVGGAPASQMDRTYGASTPTALAADVTDNANTQLYVGTAIGLGFRVTASTGAISEVTVFLDHSISSIEIDPITRAVYYIGQNINGGNNAVIRVDPNTGGAVRDMASIPRAGTPIRGTAMDPTGRRLFVVHNDNSVFRIDFGNCMTAGFGTSCTSCLDPDLGDNLYCDWCYDPGACRASCTNPLGSDAPAESVLSNCPTVTLVNPSSALAGSSVAVSLSNSVARPQLGLQCRIGMTNVPGTLNGGNNILTCTSPVAGTGTQQVSIVYGAQPTVSFVSNTMPFTFVTCSSNANCASCSANSVCAWCLSTSSCMNDGLCASQEINAPASCPTLALAPSSTAVGVPANVVASGGPFVNTGSYTLVLNPGGGTHPGTFVSSSQVNFAVSNAVAVAVYEARVDLGGNDYFNFPMGAGPSFEVFNCAGITDCQSCTAPTVTCNWCTEDQTCRSSAASCPLSATTPQGQCPMSTGLSPQSAFTTPAPGTLSVFTSGAFPTTGTWTCNFGGSTVPATRNTVAPASIVCSSIPVAGGTGSVTLSVIHSVGGTITQQPFLYFSCSEFSDCQNCTAPALSGACQYCFSDNTCSTVGMGTCATGFFPTCPVINSFAPQGVRVNAMESIVFSVSSVPNLVGTFECVWTAPTMVITRTMATRNSPTQVTCSSPAGIPSLILPPPDATFYTTTVYVETPTNAVLTDTATLTIFDCFVSAIDCPSCGALPFCGFCLGGNSCTSLSDCQALSTGAPLWLDAVMGCPSISSVEPDHATLEGNDQITVTGDLFLLDILECQFGDLGRTPATRVGGSTTQLTCLSPPGLEEIANFTVVQSGIPYSDNSATFTFVDCGQFETCEACAAETATGLCGWCLTSASCTPQFQCSDSADWTTTACPSLNSITPGFIEDGSRQDFSLIGTLFRPGVSVMFNTEPATDVVVVSDTEITGRSPRLAVGSASVALQIQGRPYASASLNFNVIPASSEGISPGVAGGVAVAVVCCFFCVGLCIFYVIWVRFQKILSRRTVKVVEPKWDVIAYTNWLAPVYKGKTLKDYTDLLALLLDKEKGPQLQVALDVVTQATEQDPFARSLVYIYCNEGLGTQLIITWIDTEIKQAVEEEAIDTIFRANSIVTRMFKYYAKIVGTRYLFDTLARFVAEMELSRKLQLENEEELNTIRDMELDPNKMNPEEDELQIQENKTNLLSFSQKILNTILRSVSNIPAPILSCIVHVKKKVQATFGNPTLTHKSIGAFLFLRFICPAIAAPESYFREDPPDPYIRRQLVLLSKILQNLANNVQFGGKEQFMAPLNPFIIDNADNLRKFYSKIDDVAPDAGGVDIPNEVLLNACSWTHIHIDSLMSQLQPELKKSSKKYPQGEEIFKALKFEIDRLDPPPKKLTKKN